MRAKKIHGGQSIGLRLDESLSDLWNRLKKVTKNRKIIQLQFLDHGAPDQQLVGGDRLTASADISKNIASKMSSGSEIVFYGCTVLKGDKTGQVKLSMLATHIATTLLTRGGKIVGFNTPIELDIKKMRVIEPKTKNRVELYFPACSGTAVISEILQFMRDMIKRKYKVKYAKVILERLRETDKTMLIDFAKYPYDYPNSGYYA
jgi:hypothetical protein